VRPRSLNRSQELSADATGLHMAEGGTLRFGDPDGYAAAFTNLRLNLTITGGGDFKSQLTWLKLKFLQVYRCRESLPRIGYISFSPEPIFLSFPINAASPVFGGIAVRNGNMVFHSRGERVHQRFSGLCQWGLVALSAEQLASSYKALTGQTIAMPRESTLIKPPRVAVLIFQRLFAQICNLAEDDKKLIERPEVARALEQEMFHAIINCLAASEPEHNRKTRLQHADVMTRFEEVLSKHSDRKFSIPALCAEIGVAERTLRMCCSEFLGVSPTKYVLLQRLNRARAALRRADPFSMTVAEVARNHHFLELGRFAVTYRTTFGESPSTTLQRDAVSKLAETA
jgi:AraC-like DNA-binding protein